MMRNTKILVLGLVAVAIYPLASQAGSGVVALQTADASCPDASGGIYVDCGNGTVTDNRTGLVWLANADCYGAVTWNEAIEFVAGLADQSPGSAAAAHDCGLSDGSSPGEWRLPSVAEWEAMIADAGSCIPSITDDGGSGCWITGPSTFSDVVSFFYWSSTQFGNFGTLAWGADLGNNIITNDGTAADNYLWPVRGGQ